MPVRLEGPSGVLATATTDGDGRISVMAAGSVGIHRLVFDTAAYFTATGQRGFYPEVIIAFTLEEGNYHVPLLLSPFAYSTYRGS